MMIFLTVIMTGCAAGLAVRPPPDRSAMRRLRAAPIERAARRRRRGDRTMIIVAVIILAPPLLLGSALGQRFGWLAVPVMIMVATGWLVVLRGRRRRRTRQSRREVAQACSILAAQVRIGQPPLVALRSAAEDCAVLRPALATAELGGDVAGRWLDQSREPGRAGLADLARAWQLSTATGSGMAEALEDVSAAMVADESLSLVIGSEAAGPRASGKVMAALPLVGVGLGYLIGGDPIDFLINSAAGWGCLIAGAVLAAVGVLWMEQVADRAGGGG